MRTCLRAGSIFLGLVCLGLPLSPAPRPMDNPTPEVVDGPSPGKSRYIWFHLFLDKTTRGKFDYKDARGQVHTAERRTFHLRYMYLDGPPGLASARVFKVAEAKENPQVPPGGGTWRSIGSGVYTLGPQSRDMVRKVFESLKTTKIDGIDPQWGGPAGDYVLLYFRGHEVTS